MAAKSKSRKRMARVPDEAVVPIESAKKDEVSTEQFIPASMLGKINRRLDRKSKS